MRISTAFADYNETILKALWNGKEPGT